MRYVQQATLFFLLMLFSPLLPIVAAQGVYAEQMEDSDNWEVWGAMFFDATYEEDYYYDFQGESILVEDSSIVDAAPRQDCYPGLACAEVSCTGYPGYTYYGVGTFYYKQVIYVPTPPLPYEEGWYDPYGYPNYDPDTYYDVYHYFPPIYEMYIENNEWEALGNFSTEAIAQNIAQPTISVNPSTVTRGGTATFSVNGAGPCTISDWSFEGSLGNVDGPDSAASWGGTIVHGGLAKVKARCKNKDFNLQVSISVNSRSGWATSPANATQGSVGTFNVPPSPGDALGRHVYTWSYSFAWDAIPSGPNYGYRYVTSMSPSQSFTWGLSAALDPSNAFYQRQTGQGGNISGSKLRSNTINHESANAAVSHYYFYRQGLVANDPKAALESYVAGPSSQTFQTDATSLVDQKFNQVDNARAVEPCNGLVNKDCLDNCTDNGFVDYGSPVPAYLASFWNRLAGDFAAEIAYSGSPGCLPKTIHLRFKGIN